MGTRKEETGNAHGMAKSMGMHRKKVNLSDYNA